MAGGDEEERGCEEADTSISASVGAESIRRVTQSRTSSLSRSASCSNHQEAA